MDYVIRLAVGRCTFWLLVAIAFAILAVVKRETVLGKWWLAISWQTTVVDATIWLLRSFGTIGPPNEAEIRGRILLSIIALLIPLVAWIVICLPKFSAETSTPGLRFLCLACGLTAVDLILLLHSCSVLASAFGPH